MKKSVSPTDIAKVLVEKVREQQLQSPNGKAQVILNAVSAYYEIPVELIKSKSRKKEYITARFMVCYYAKKKTKLTLAQIGQVLGGKDHATVLHCLRTLENDMETTPHIKKQCEEIGKLVDKKLDQLKQLGDKPVLHHLFVNGENCFLSETQPTIIFLNINMERVNEIMKHQPLSEMLIESNINDTNTHKITYL